MFVTLSYEGIVNLALQIEGDAPNTKIVSRADDERRKSLKCQQNPQKILPLEPLELY